MNSDSTQHDSNNPKAFQPYQPELLSPGGSNVPQETPTIRMVMEGLAAQNQQLKINYQELERRNQLIEQQQMNQTKRHSTPRLVVFLMFVVVGIGAIFAATNRDAFIRFKQLVAVLFSAKGDTSTTNAQGVAGPNIGSPKSTVSDAEIAQNISVTKNKIGNIGSEQWDYEVSSVGVTETNIPTAKRLGKEQAALFFNAVIKPHNDLAVESDRADLKIDALPSDGKGFSAIFLSSKIDEIGTKAKILIDSLSSTKEEKSARQYVTKTGKLLVAFNANLDLIAKAEKPRDEVATESSTASESEEPSSDDDSVQPATRPRRVTPMEGQ